MIAVECARSIGANPAAGRLEILEAIGDSALRGGRDRADPSRRAARLAAGGGNAAMVASGDLGRRGARVVRRPRSVGRVRLYLAARPLAEKETGATRPGFQVPRSALAIIRVLTTAGHVAEFSLKHAPGEVAPAIEPVAARAGHFTGCDHSPVDDPSVRRRPLWRDRPQTGIALRLGPYYNPEEA